MSSVSCNLLVVLGPTASGKTRLGVQLALALGGEIISADSRQVYRGLNLGAGKDLDEYEVDGRRIPYHLIDIVDLSHEFNVFEYQRRFYDAFEDIAARDAMPIVVGGTGLYVEAVLRPYRMADVPEDAELRREVSTLSMEELAKRLLDLKGDVHNVTDLENRERLVRAIEIAAYSASHEPEPAPEIKPFILGVRWPRDVLRRRIRERLVQRIRAGMIEEVKGLVDSGIPWEKLEFRGLEYRYVADYLQDRIRNQNDLIQKLAAAIVQFAKRQETWFRRMERNGHEIHWIDGADFATAMKCVATARVAERGTPR